MLNWVIHKLVWIVIVGPKCRIAMRLTCLSLALEESQRDARSRGQLIERDSEGLPMNLRLPPKKPDIKHLVVTSSSSSGILSPITYCGRESDSPPQEFLGEVTASVIHGMYDGALNLPRNSNPMDEGPCVSGKRQRSRKS